MCSLSSSLKVITTCDNVVNGWIIILERKRISRRNFAFRCFSCLLYFLSFVKRFPAQLGESARENSVTYFIRLHFSNWTGCSPKKVFFKIANREHWGRRRRKLINPRTSALDNTNSLELSYFFLSHYVRANQQLNKSSMFFQT